MRDLGNTEGQTTTASTAVFHFFVGGTEAPSADEMVPGSEPGRRLQARTQGSPSTAPWAPLKVLRSVHLVFNTASVDSKHCFQEETGAWDVK